MAAKKRKPPAPKKKKRAKRPETQDVTPTEDGGAIVNTGSDSDSDVTDLPDGGAIVQMEKDEKIETADEDDFYSNLVGDLDGPDVDELGLGLFRKIDFDKKSREQRDKQYEEAIRRTGMGNDAPGGAMFNGASRAVHPMITKGCVDYASRAIKELLPKGGVVKYFIPGASTKERVQKAQRKAAYMNWQCMVQMKGLRHEMESGLTQEPLGGAFYLRLTPDPDTNKPAPVMVPIDDVYLPYAASSFYTSERITYAEHITEFEYKRRVKSGMYIDADLLPPSQIPEETKSAVAAAKVEGKEPDTYNQDGLRIVYEVMLSADLGDKKAKGVAPYLVSLDEVTKEPIRIVRNWEEKDDEKEPMYWMVEFPFIPWRGAYPIGLIHLIGSLAAAATGALRALLDSAHINNMPTLLKLKGAALSGQQVTPAPTEMAEVTGGVGTDDIRKLMMAVPFNPPSLVLYQLLGFLVEQGEDVVKVTLDTLTDQSANQAPVGTTLALIEQGMKVLSAIHSRQHYAFQQFLAILHRINRMYLTDDEVVNDTGDLMVFREDFEGPMDVIPVSDPEIFTDIQRYAQMQLVAQRAQLFPQLYNLYNVEKMILERTKIPDADTLLNPAPQITEQNQVNENVAMCLGRPVQAFPDQDHLGHIQVLLDFMSSQFLGQLPIIAPTFLPAALNHLKEHLVLWYADFMERLASQSVQEASGKDDITIATMMKYDDPKTRQAADKLLGAISAKYAIPQVAQTFASIPAVIQRAQGILQQLQQAAQSQVQDPTAAGKMAVANVNAQVQREKNAQEAQSDAADQALRTQELQADTAKTTAEVQARKDQQQQQSSTELTTTELRQQHEDQRAAAENASKESINAADNQTAQSISAANAARRAAPVTTGTAVGKPEGGI